MLLRVTKLVFLENIKKINLSAHRIFIKTPFKGVLLVDEGSFNTKMSVKVTPFT